MHKDENYYDYRILSEIRFGFIHPYLVAGMGEPWVKRIDATLRLLNEQGIGAILTVTENDLYGEFYRDAGFLCYHEPIEDCMPPAKEGMDRGLDFINSCLTKGHGVAVHCFQGRSRTGTVLAAWVGLKESLNLQGAIERVYAARPYSVITNTQRVFLTEYLNERNRYTFSTSK